MSRGGCALIVAVLSAVAVRGAGPTAVGEWELGTYVGGAGGVDLDTGLVASLPAAGARRGGAAAAPSRVRVRTADDGGGGLRVVEVRPAAEPRAAAAPVCPSTMALVNGTGLTKDPYDSSTQDSWEACCARCAAAAGKCAAWTWRGGNGNKDHKCFLADSSQVSPHSVTDAVSGTAAAPPPPPPGPAPQPPLGYQPNIIFILTDDQDRTLGSDDYTDEGSLASMPGTRRVLTEQGAFFSNYHVNTPICCPSRTEFFTGRYFHNIRGAGGKGCMHANTTHAGLRAEGMFGLLTSAGYATGVFGKTTNNQQPLLDLLVSEKSATYIDSPVDYNNFMGKPYFHLEANGTTYTETLPETDPVYGTLYQTTQLGNRSLAWLDTVLGDPSRPFFLYLGPHAPHFPATPAPWYEHLWDNVSAPVTPNYNLSCPDKTQHIRQNPPLTATAKCWEDQHFRDRWASLKSVDEIVEEFDAKLAAAKVSDKTYIFFTGDHGYKFGQWRVGVSKQHPYETDIHVPFLVRGPGVAKGAVHAQMSGSVDLLPTILALAGVAQPADMDGRSMLPFLAPSLAAAAAPAWRDRWLNEYESVGTYYNDHAGCWSPPGYSDKCGGKMPRGPAGSVSSCKERNETGAGECYFVDSTHSNSWRALRVRNATHNTQYIEYDSTWAWGDGALDWYELYDVAADPYQMTNIYDRQPAAVRAAWHAELEAYYLCKGGACP